MKTAKLQRRIRILRWIHKTLGLQSYIRITMQLQNSVKVHAQVGGDPATADYFRDVLIKQMAYDILDMGLAEIERAQPDNDHILGLETWRATVKIILP